ISAGNVRRPASGTPCFGSSDLGSLRIASRAMRLDRLAFGVMYRVGFTPWDGHKLPARLTDLIEGDTALPKGKALDVGCGTGETSIYLARHGWAVTAVDFVKVALERARAKTEAAGMSVRFLQADVTQLGSSDV